MTGPHPIPPRVIAFYLPQYHPIPENDAWWGTGFTEWSNVAKARPRFPGHYQPHIPADLGFYDLRLPETRAAQAALAREHGIGAFCYYHYWFNGKLLLERPFDEVLASGEPDFPFCLCWANENWTRRWDGQEADVLMGQDYERYDPVAHVAWLARAFADSRYVKVDGRPLFLVYRADQIPRLGEVAASWQRAAREMGFPGLYLVAVKHMQFTLGDADTLALGFDALVDFQPNPADVADAHRRLVRRNTPLAAARDRLAAWLVRLFPKLEECSRYSYGRIVAHCVAKPPADSRTFPCVFPAWDNSPRRRTRVTVIANDDASLFGTWLANALERVEAYPAGERLVFINAWNEWGEGCHLEPDLRNGRRFLEEVGRLAGNGTPHRGGR